MVGDGQVVNRWKSVDGAGSQTLLEASAPELSRIVASPTHHGAVIT